MKVFVDLDGVLADWLGPALAVMGQDPAEVYRRWEQMTPRPWNIFDVIGLTPSQGWRKIDQAGDAFWANLPIKPYARELLALCEDIGETAILTSPSLHPSRFCRAHQRHATCTRAHCRTSRRRAQGKTERSARR